MKAKTWQEIKSLSAPELEAKLCAAQEQLFRMRFRHASTPVKNPLEIRFLRRSIARFKTLLHQKQAEAKS
jgi:large subunit ribosomal protein L29